MSKWMNFGCRWGLLLMLGMLLAGPLARAADDEPAAKSPPLPQPDFSEQTPCDVLEVTAADTLVVEWDGDRVTVRLIGLHVPRDAATVADAYAHRLLGGERVYLVQQPGWPDRDREGQAWAYVYRSPDGLFVNLELIRLGYVRAAGAGPFQHRRLFEHYEERARERSRGVWARPVGARAPTTQPVSASPSAEPREAAPSAAQAHRGASGVVYITEHGKKYHRKDCQYVRNGGQSVSVAEAKRRGLTPCKRCDPPG